MKILHVYRTYYPDTQGGLEEAIRQICLSTTGLGVVNRVLTLQREAGESMVERPECNVYRTRRHLSIKSCDISFSVLPLYKELVGWCDVVHYHFPWPFADLLALLAGGKKPYIVTYHSDIVRQRKLGMLYSPLKRLFLRRAAKVVATSMNYLATSPVLKKHANRLEVVPLGINETSYPKIDGGVLKQVEARFGRHFFLFVGVFRYYKGLHLLLDAMKGADYQVVIAGSGEIEWELKARAEALGLDNVIFPGYVSDEEKMALLHLSRGVVFPSYLRSEAFGMTLVEGAMMAKPLISAEVGTGTSYVNINGETGIVVAPGLSREIRNAMDYLHHNPIEAELMGKRARKRYLRYFTGELVGEYYMGIYSAVKLKAARIGSMQSN